MGAPEVPKGIGTRGIYPKLDPKAPIFMWFWLSNSDEFEELVEKDIVVTERINTQIENHVIRGGDELYLKNKIK